MTKLLVEGLGNFIETKLSFDEIVKAIRFWEMKVSKQAHVVKYRNKLNRIYIDLALNMKAAEQAGYSEASKIALANDIIQYYRIKLGLSRTSLWRVQKNWQNEVRKILDDIKSGVVTEAYLEQFLNKRRKRFLYM